MGAEENEAIRAAGRGAINTPAHLGAGVNLARYSLAHNSNSVPHLKGFMKTMRQTDQQNQKFTPERITLTQLPDRLKVIHPADIRTGAQVLGSFAATVMTAHEWKDMEQEHQYQQKAEGLARVLYNSLDVKRFQESVRDYAMLMGYVYDFLYIGVEVAEDDHFPDELSQAAQSAMNELSRISYGLGFADIAVTIGEKVEVPELALDPIDGWLSMHTLSEVVKYAVYHVKPEPASSLPAPDPVQEATRCEEATEETKPSTRQLALIRRSWPAILAVCAALIFARLCAGPDVYKVLGALLALLLFAVPVWSLAKRYAAKTAAQDAHAGIAK